MRRSFAIVIAVLLGLLAYAGLIRAGVVPRPGAAGAIGDVEQARSAADGTRVLFVGNSFTNNNAMPSMVRGLAAADDDRSPVFVVEYTVNGSFLEDHVRDKRLTALLEEVRWDLVVLQEQSQLLSFSPQQRSEESDPHFRTLHTTIRTYGAETILYQTWAYRDGDRRNVPGDSYASMQRRVQEGSNAVARQLPARIAPVGSAWAEALRQRPGLDLWAADGRHPGAGRLLPRRVCVLCGAVRRRPPRQHVHRRTRPRIRCVPARRRGRDGALLDGGSYPQIASCG